MHQSARHSPDPSATRRDRSVARVIDPARQQAEQRVQRFLDAALALLLDSKGEFTLHEVAARAGLSLRSFYQHFGGKHELLLALLEDQVRRSEEALRAHLQGVDDPLERLHRLVVEYYVFAASGGSKSGRGGQAAPALSRFAQSLITDHPLEVAGAFAPVRLLFEEVVGVAVEAGVVRGGGRPRRRAAVLLQTVNFNAHVMTPVDTARNRRADRVAAEELWDLLLHGLEER